VQKQAQEEELLKKKSLENKITLTNLQVEIDKLQKLINDEKAKKKKKKGCF